MEHLEAAPIKIVIGSRIRILAVYGEIDPKNGMPLHRLDTDLRPRNRNFYDIVLIIQNSHYVLRITIPARVRLTGRCAPVIVHRFEHINVVGEIVGQEIFRAV